MRLARSRHDRLIHQRFHIGAAPAEAALAQQRQDVVEHGARANQDGDRGFGLAFEQQLGAIRHDFGLRIAVTARVANAHRDAHADGFVGERIWRGSRGHRCGFVKSHRTVDRVGLVPEHALEHGIAPVHETVMRAEVAT